MIEYISDETNRLFSLQQCALLQVAVYILCLFIQYPTINEHDTSLKLLVSTRNIERLPTCETPRHPVPILIESLYLTFPSLLVYFKRFYLV